MFLCQLPICIYTFLKEVKKYLKPEGTLLLTSINPFWHFGINLFESLGLKTKSSFKSYIRPNKVEGILNAANFEKIKSYNRLILPISFFGIGKLINYLFNLFLPFLNLGIRNYLLYKNQLNEISEMTKSILVPAKNEEGNIEELINRIPKFDTQYEIIIICGESKDKTYEKIISNIQEIKSRKGKIIIVTDSKDKVLKELANDLIIIPRTNHYLFVVLATIVLQLLAYHIAVSKKLNVDQPRNLAKSVTVE